MQETKKLYYIGNRPLTPTNKLIYLITNNYYQKTNHFLIFPQPNLW